MNDDTWVDDLEVRISPRVDPAGGKHINVVITQDDDIIVIEAASEVHANELAAKIRLGLNYKKG